MCEETAAPCRHPDGIFDRDSRTVRRTPLAVACPLCARRAPSDAPRPPPPPPPPPSGRPGPRSLRNLCNHLRKTFRKFKQAVAFLLCLSYVVSLPATSTGLPLAKSAMSRQLRTIRDQAKMNTYQAKKFYDETYVQSSAHPDVRIYDNKRIDFFFEHTLDHYDFPNEPVFSEKVIKEGTTVKEFTQIFYDCFLRYNATFDMIGEENNVRHRLKVLLEEIKEYVATEHIEPLKEKYEEIDVKLDMDEASNESTAGRWVRNVVLYRDFVKTMEYVVQAYNYFLGE